MSDKVDDLKNDATKKADDVRDDGEKAFDNVRRDAGRTTDGHRDRGGDTRAKADDALSGARDLFNKLKQRLTGGNR